MKITSEKGFEIFCHFLIFLVFLAIFEKSKKSNLRASSVKK